MKNGTPKILERALILFLRVYQIVISPIFQIIGVRCKYSVSCSEFAILSIKNEGYKQGTKQALKRLLSCI